MSIQSLRFHFFCIVLIVVFSATILANPATASSTGPRTTIVSGNDQAAIVGAKLPHPFVVRVIGSNGKPVEGATVVWTVTSGGGSFSHESTVTNADGKASNTMTLGTVAQWDKATAYSGKSGVTFGANAEAGPAKTIGLYSGSQQTATVGSTLPNNLQVICHDLYGNLSGTTQIDWTVVGGGGSVPWPESPTVSGVAVKSMTLGTVPGANTISATIDGTSTSYIFTETAVAGAPTTISIVSGNSQKGKAGVPLANPLTVLVTDKYSNPLNGVQVDWIASTAGDTLGSPTTVTSSSGDTSNILTLDSTYGLHKIVATVDGTTITQKLVAREAFAATIQETPSANANPKAMQPYFLGLSYPRTWVSTPLFNANNTALVALFKNLGPGVLRFLAEEPFPPGVIWKPDGRGLIYKTVSTADIARVAAFAKAVNWKVLYGIALIGNTPASAASEATVAAQEFGDSLLGFEIGNEPDAYYAPHYGTPPVPQIPGYTWEDFISPTQLVSDGVQMPSWTVLASAIRAAVPNAPLTGPAGGFDWAVDFAGSSQAPQLSLLTMHYYAGWPAESPTMTTLLAPDPRLAVRFPGLQQAAIAANIPGGYRISECNSISGSMPGLTNAFGAALWTIDFLFENAFGQSSGVNFTSEANYTPLADDERTITGIGPDYYGLFVYAMIAKGGKLMTMKISPNWSTTFSAYAVLQPDGSTDAILSNKDPNASVTVSVTPQGAISQATSLLLTAPSLNSTTGFTLGGSPINIDGSWTPTSNPALPIAGNAVVVKIPPGSAQLVHMQ